MPRPKNTEARRAQIVSALAEVMAERGYEGASIQRIAKTAGLAPGLVHYHFENKQQILLTLVRTIIAGARGRVEARLARASSPRRRVMAFLDAFLATGDGADQGAVALWALIGAEAVRQPEVREVYQSWIGEAKKALEELLRAACREEGRSTRGLSATAAGLLATIEGFFAMSAAAPDLVPAGSAASIAKRMAAGLIESQAEAV